MRVLIIADESFAARERAMLSRLEVGLADEGVRIIHAVPRRAAQWHHPEVFLQAVQYEDRGLIVSRAWRAQQLLASIERLGEGEAQPIDVVHAFGRGCWGVAIEAARQAEAALALEVADAASAVAAARLRLPDGAAPLLLVPDATLERLIHAEAPRAAVRVAPWGVHTPSTPRDALRDGRDVAVMIDGSGGDRAGMAACMEGIGAVAPRYPDLMFFAEAEAVRLSGVWPMVKRLGLSERFTLTPDMEARRELALRADALILPEALGEHRTLTLDAMAAGMVVIAAADPLVSVLIDGRTARLIERPDGSAWAAALEWMLAQRDEARALAASAREHIRQHCRASTYIAAVIDAYEWMTAGESIPFAPPGV